MKSSHLATYGLLLLSTGTMAQNLPSLTWGTGSVNSESKITHETQVGYVESLDSRMNKVDGKWSTKTDEASEDAANTLKKSIEALELLAAAASKSATDANSAISTLDDTYATDLELAAANVSVDPETVCKDLGGSWSKGSTPAARSFTMSKVAPITKGYKWNRDYRGNGTYCDSAFPWDDPNELYNSVKGDNAFTYDEINTRMLSEWGRIYSNQSATTLFSQEMSIVAAEMGGLCAPLHDMIGFIFEDKQTLVVTEIPQASNARCEL